MVCGSRAVVFQFTPLREGRPASTVTVEPQNDFNSRPSARGDRTAALHAAIAALFQFTPLREGRLEEVGQIVGVDKFQFTPLREGRQG